MSSQDRGRGTRSDYADAGRRIGRELVEHGYGLVYGGGNVGLMTVVADAVLESHGHVTGVIPETLVDKEVVHRGLSELRIVRSMHERKAMMAELSDGFVALTGRNRNNGRIFRGLELGAARRT